MNKRANLAAALQTASRGGGAVAEAQGSSASTASVLSIGSRAPSRIGKKTVAAHFDPAVSKQLKQLGLERDTSTQALLREAINDLFAKYGKPPIA
jgi:uroporphyrinogen-III synthase